MQFKNDTIIFFIHYNKIQNFQLHYYFSGILQKMISVDKIEFDNQIIMQVFIKIIF